MRLLLLISGLLLVACGDNSGGPDGSMIDSRIPDSYAYKQDRGAVKPVDMAPAPDKQLPPDKSLPPDQGGGVLKTHTAPVKLNFDSDNGGLVGNRDWEWKPSINFNKNDSKCTDSVITPPTSGHSGTGMWGTRINGCHSGLGNDATNDGKTSPTCTNKNLNDDHVLKFRVAIPAGWNTVDFTFYHWTDLKYPFDWHEVLLDTGSGPKLFKDGKTTDKGYYCKASPTKPTAWVKEHLYLDNLAGKTVTISFHMMDSAVINRAGWYIDDIEVKKFQ